jgi:hypothetical protein
MARERTIHILALGQSNLANHGQSRRASTFGRALHRGAFHPLADPVPGGSGKTGSIWPRLAGMLEERGDVADLVLSLRAVGGTSIADWSLGGSCYESLSAELPAIAMATPPVTHVVFHQGERDNLLGTSTADYVERFGHLHRLVEGVLPGVKWIVCQASLRAEIVAPAVTEAQRIVVCTHWNCSLGPNTDELQEGFRYDGTHLNSAGLDEFARRLVLLL